MYEIDIPDRLKAHMRERRGALHGFGDVMTAGEAQDYLLADAGGNAATA